MKKLILICAALLCFSACKKDDPAPNFQGFGKGPKVATITFMDGDFSDLTAYRYDKAGRITQITTQRFKKGSEQAIKNVTHLISYSGAWATIKTTEKGTDINSGTIDYSRTTTVRLSKTGLFEVGVSEGAGQRTDAMTSTNITEKQELVASYDADGQLFVYAYNQYSDISLGESATPEVQGKTTHTTAYKWTDGVISALEYTTNVLRDNELINTWKLRCDYEYTTTPNTTNIDFTNTLGTDLINELGFQGKTCPLIPQRIVYTSGSDAPFDIEFVFKMYNGGLVSSVTRTYGGAEVSWAFTYTE